MARSDGEEAGVDIKLTHERLAALQIIVWQGGFEDKRLAGERMGEFDASGVEHLTGGIEAVHGCAAAVKGVAPDGMAEMGEVDANLVRAAGVQEALDFGTGFALLEHTVIGPGGSAVGWVFFHRHLFSVDGMATDGAVAFTGDAAEDSGAEGAIDFLYLAFGENLRELFVGLVGFRDENHAAGVLVEAMDDAEAFAAPAPGEVRAAMVDERVDQRAGPVARGGMDDEAGLLVEREQGVVLVDDIERDCLAGKIGGDNGLHRLGVDGDAVPCPQAVARLTLRGRGFEMDQPLFEQSLDLRARTLQRGGEENVEPFPGVGARLLGADRMDVGRAHGFDNCNFNPDMALCANGNFPGPWKIQSPRR